MCCRHKGNNDHCVDVSSTIVDGPLDKTVYSLTTVSFQCTSDISTVIYWKYSETPDSSVYVFGHRGRNEQLFDARFVKTVNGSTSILTIRDVQISDAGIYKCRESNSDNPLSAKLTVIG